jgi:hypothetical protein
MTMAARKFEGDVIELRAANPAGDIACDFTIATPEARSGLAEALERALVPPPAPVEGGVEVRFRPEGWDAVQRYVDLESRCCSFLTLAARRESDGVVLTVTGREDAQDFIRGIFSRGGATLP